MIINTQIKKYRNELNMTQEALAEKMYISRQSVSKWENGESLPSVENLIMLSEILAIPLDELVKGKRAYPDDFAFGKPKNHIPVFLLLFFPITIFTLGLFASSSLMSLIVWLAVAVFTFALGTVVSFFDFKRYHSYFVITRYGIEVDTTAGANEFIRTLRGIAGERTSKLIPFTEIDIIETTFDTHGYSPVKSTVLNYRPRQMYRVREPFVWKLFTHDGNVYVLNLDLLFYRDSDEYRYFPSIINDFNAKGITFSDPAGVCDAIQLESSIIDAAYRKQKIFTSQK